MDNFKSVSRIITKHIVIFIVVIVITAFVVLGFKSSESKYFIEGLAQGTSYHITYYSSLQKIQKREIDSIITKIDSSMSLYKPYSLITAFNNASRLGKMDNHFKTVIKRSFEISEASNGSFDITVFPLVEAWGFGVKSENSLPDSTRIAQLLKLVGYKNLKINGDLLLKDIPEIKIDVNGIAQGYTVDLIADFLEGRGIKSYLVELGGELRVKGKKPGQKKFKIGIQSVDESDFAPINKYVELNRGAITTSGNYIKFHQEGNQRTNHLINPHTGFYVNNGMISATVYAKDAITADGFDNALMVLGVDGALKLVEKTADIEAYLIYRSADGKIRGTCSTGFPQIKPN